MVAMCYNLGCNITQAERRMLLMAKVNKDMVISEVLNMDRGTAPIFFKHGMHCLGCPSASGESIADACAAHGIDADKLVDELNAYFDSKQ